MKKKIFGGIAVLAFAAIAAFNVNMSANRNTNLLSDLNLANIEALAQKETNVDVGTVGFKLDVKYEKIIFGTEVKFKKVESCIQVNFMVTCTITLKSTSPIVT